jgi:hypothetical protein
MCYSIVNKGLNKQNYGKQPSSKFQVNWLHYEKARFFLENTGKLST